MRANHANQTPQPSEERGRTWRLPWPGRRERDGRGGRRGTAGTIGIGGADGVGGPHGVRDRSGAPVGVPGRWALRLPRPGTLAAGGAVLAAQVCGLGLGVSEACAAAGAPSVAQADTSAVQRPGGRTTLRSGGTGTGTGKRTGVRGGVDAVESTGDALVGHLTGTAGPLLGGSTAPVEHVLQEQIRAGGLPLPGQVATLPDAFAIASGLLPAVPAQGGRGSTDGTGDTDDVIQRASRSTNGAAGGPARGATDLVSVAVPAQRGTASAVPAPIAPAADGRAAGPRQALPAGDGAAPAADAAERDELALAAATPARPDGGDTGTAVLVPIAAGLLLTGAAMYKHRGLPRGH
ncbi:hypothetical protein ACGFX4_37680 [Kitasatospora sp. NPDC048365]|uniref:hypothetical protein n=1 Tax=Kitasatospora sp. NPDC048365 TaxID=3364050 RepID=UPI00371F2700